MEQGARFVPTFRLAAFSFELLWPFVEHFPLIPYGFPFAMPSSPLRTGIVILAAGASRRMGRPKQLLPLGETTLLEHAVDAALNSTAWPVIVVLGAQAAEIRPLLARRPVLVAENPTWSEGMASSLRAGLTLMNAFSIRVDAVLFALCDQPAFSADLVQRFIATQQATQRSVVAARYSGNLGAPALFTRPHFAALSALVGDEGARKLIAQVPAGEVEAIDLPELAHDLDTPEDYANYCGVSAQPAPAPAPFKATP